MNLSSSVIPLDIRYKFYERSIISATLQDVQTYGIPPGYSISINFIAHYPGAKLPASIADEFSTDANDEVSIIFKDGQFWDLQIDYFGFQVAVILDGIKQLIYIPLASITQYKNTIQSTFLNCSALPKEFGAKLKVDSSIINYFLT